MAKAVLERLYTPTSDFSAPHSHFLSQETAKILMQHIAGIASGSLAAEQKEGGTTRVQSNTIEQVCAPLTLAPCRHEHLSLSPPRFWLLILYLRHLATPALAAMTTAVVSASSRSFVSDRLPLGGSSNPSSAKWRLLAPSARYAVAVTQVKKSLLSPSLIAHLSS